MIPILRQLLTITLIFFSFFILLLLIFPRLSLQSSTSSQSLQEALLYRSFSVSSQSLCSDSSESPCMSSNPPSDSDSSALATVSNALTPIELAYIQQHFFCENANYITIPTIHTDATDTTTIPGPNYHEVIIDTPHHFTMNIFNQGDYVSKTIDDQKIWERENTEALLAVMRGINPLEINKMITMGQLNQPTSTSKHTEESYFLDIGSNIGWFSLVMAAHNYPTISFEPMKMNEIMYRQSICLNSPEIQSNILYFHYALGEHANVCAMYSDINNQGDGHVKCLNNAESKKESIPTEDSSNTETDHQLFSMKNLMLDPTAWSSLSSNLTFGKNYVYRNMISIVRLDDMLLPFFDTTSTIRQQQKILPPNSPFAYAPQQFRLMKIDTEGYEYQTFLGAHEFLLQKRVRYIFSEFSPRMLSEKSGEGSPEAYLRYFWELGYTVRQIRANFDVSTIITEKNEKFCDWGNICELFIHHNDDQ